MRLELTNSDNQIVCPKWYDRRKVRRDDLELVSIKTDVKVVVDTSIDQTQKMRLSRGQGGLRILSTGR